MNLVKSFLLLWLICTSVGNSGDGRVAALELDNQASLNYSILSTLFRSPRPDDETAIHLDFDNRN